ncbi:MAG: hypothetical protein Ct9H300mP16_15170 [Pseudomonadota bacterium]|nr:MAG: hypothetical protein Ct9H300mP16_15170 [Pseudomonadota bacterium]
MGVWRLLNLFERKSVPITLFAVAMALERNPQVAEAAVKAGHEICSHGYRWIDYRDYRRRLSASICTSRSRSSSGCPGERPLGWYTGRTSENTRGLVVEEGGFLYDADDYNDDLPFWTRVTGTDHLVVPYTLDPTICALPHPRGSIPGSSFWPTCVMPLTRSMRKARYAAHDVGWTPLSPGGAARALSGRGAVHRSRFAT